MRLIDVGIFLNREEKMQKQATVGRDAQPVLTERDDAVTDYAILSHRWVDSEVGYSEMLELATMDNRNKIRGRPGYKKIVKSCKQAKNDGLKWLWVDTCCIDKRNSSELSEALNSMFRWYENSKRCYAYLHDVDGFPTSRDTERFAGSEGWPEWFSRGWTLQELIAPRDLQFFSMTWKPIGDKRDLASTLEKITGVPSKVFQDGLASYGPSIAQVMSWAADRRTTRIEDRAYSLMGLLDVNMPMLYGEGKKAFLRLQLEVIRKSNDQTIFAWNPTAETQQTIETTGVLADDPSSFRDCHDIIQIESKEFDSRLSAFWGESLPIIHYPPNYLTLYGAYAKTGTRSPLRKHYPLWNYLTLCDWTIEMQASHAFTITNVGIQANLPLRRYPGSPLVIQVVLSCSREGNWRPITIDVVPWRSRCYRYIGNVGLGPLLCSYQHSQLILAYEPTGAPSGIVIEDAEGAAAMVLDMCAARTAIAAVGRNVQPIGVTTTAIHSILSSGLSPQMTAFFIFLMHASSIFRPLYLILFALLQRDPWSFGKGICTPIIIFWTLSGHLATYPNFRHCTAETPPPGGYILNSNKDIVLLRGAGRTATSLTRGEAVIPFDARPRACGLVAWLFAFSIALTGLLLWHSTEPFSLPAFNLEMALFVPGPVIYVARTRYFEWQLKRILKPKKYVFGTRTSGVVFILLLLRTEKTEEVMNELLSTPNTKAWRKWKTTIVDRIRCQGSFDFNTSDWDDGTWSDTEKKFLTGLFQDARDAHEFFERHFAESGSMT